MKVIIDGKEYVEKVEEKKEMTFRKEINKYPERFERLTDEGWEEVIHSDGVSNSKNAIVLNSQWNRNTMDDIVFYVEFFDEEGNNYKEIIRRK